ncbi:integrase [Ancylobacter sp. Lp-2]|uniref:integrase n=1 Tax=Ancylobacter sp. Lp-2 TaxID=2881339 RepID=UPI001E47542D|nr:integrase [Ancylobacter sp. Lp-2]MCB4771992.1 integrase [Ancylobacter sp. Lp-2]
MHTNHENTTAARAWNAGRIVGAKPPLKPKHIWALRTRLQIANRVRDLAMLNLAIDSKLPSRSHSGGHVTRQYGRLVDQWGGLIGLNPADYGTYSLRRTKVAILYKRTGNLRACQLLLGHTKLESTVRYLGIEVDDTLSSSEKTEI